MRRIAWIALLWMLLIGFVVLDYVKAPSPHDPFAEPPPWALGHEPSGRGGHCSAAPR